MSRFMKTSTRMGSVALFPETTGFDNEILASSDRKFERLSAIQQNSVFDRLSETGDSVQ